MEQTTCTLYHGVAYSIAGATDCPYYAQCERLGTILSQTLGLVQLVRKRPTDPEEWLPYVRRLCTTYGFRYDTEAHQNANQDRVIVWNTKTCRLVGNGGAEAFMNEVQTKFGIVSDLSWGHMTPIARENKALRAKELEYKSKPIHIIMAGPPLAGKTLQSQRLCAEYGLVHISPRELILKAMRQHNPAAKHFAYYLKYEQRVPDRMLLKLVKDRLKQSDAQTKGWVLDGFPATAAQLIGLSDLRLDLRAFVLLHVPESLIPQRSQAHTEEVQKAPEKEQETGDVKATTYESPNKTTEDSTTKPSKQKDQMEMLMEEAMSASSLQKRRAEYRANAPIVTRAFEDQLVVVDGAQTPDTVSTVLFQEIAQR